MSTRPLSAYSCVRTEGALLPADVLARIAAGDPAFGGLDPESYHLAHSEKIGEAANRAWNRLQARWATFQTERAKLSSNDTGTSLTRERWLLPLFEELKFGRLQHVPKLEIDGKSYPVSHLWHHVPIHLVGCNVDLDKRDRAAGARRSSPHSLVQELLNRSPLYLWGIVSNGLRLRLLRDNVSLTRQAYVEFDLEAMMTGESYPDFVLMFLILHQSRFEGERPELCHLEKWTQAARSEGVRVLDGLRDGVQKAIEHLGKGFLAHPANVELRERLRTGALDKQEFYRQLLRLVYRLMFLFVAEDRGLLLIPSAAPEAKKRYQEYYSTARLRRLASTRAGSRHHDLYCCLKVVMDKLSREGCPELALPALGSFLFSPNALPDLERGELSNLYLLDAIRSLAVTQTSQSRRVVDYKNLGAEELGSVYESLLELHPELNAEAATFQLKVAAGSERKRTGSYYTPTSLISCLLDSALDPVLDEAAKQPDPEAAILKLKVVDPACGSGHFLIAAAHRISKRLAAVRTGEEEPPPEAQRRAIRDVIGHCIYGVDLNPMAVELCKVSLWMEALEPGKPLSFLEHRIQCGNSLLGATPALLAEGIPDDAFTPIEGDDPEVCREFKRINRDERKKQMRLFAATTEPWQQLGNFAASLMNLDAAGDDSIEAIREKERMYEQAIRSADYLDGRFWADAWCAAFVWKKTSEFNYPITEEVFRRIERNPHACEPWMRHEIERLAGQYRFFHWHLAFPDVFRVPPAGEKPENTQTGWNGGFDVVLGNPPWERIKLQEKEWFAARHPEIANAPNKAVRERLIRSLRETDPALHTAFGEALRRAEGESVLVRNTGRYPLCGVGDVNTYAVFAECGRSLLNPHGRMGVIVPSGIATDHTTRNFFASLVDSNTLVSLYDFENREGIFDAVDRRVKFCLLTITGSPMPKGSAADFFCFAHSVADLADPERHFTLTAEEIALVNPNTRTCPMFRTKRDAEITKGIYRRIPVLVNEAIGENPWQISFRQGLFNMTSDSGLFRTREQLEAEGFVLQGNHFWRGEEEYVPLYEAKMMHQYTHRFGDYAMKPPGSQDTELPRIPPERLADPNYFVLPRYWVRRQDLPDLGGRQWLLGFRDIARSTDERTAIFAVLPPVGVGNKIPILQTESVALPLLGCSSSFVFDYALRQKLGGTTMNFFYIKQTPVLPPTCYTEAHLAFLTPRVLELTYTAWDLAGFARDHGYDGPPFRWDEERRFLIRCELDALYFHLYGIARDDVDYILDTFPIVRRKDEAAYGEYRTKRVILEIYDAMAEAERTGVPYKTRLDPPPADPRIAHPR